MATSIQQSPTPDATGTTRGLVSAGTQSFGGAKTFTGAIAASNLSGTNSGDITLASAGSTPSASGASLSGQALTLQPADGTHPGLVSTGTQTIAGAKTFSSTVTAPEFNVSADGGFVGYDGGASHKSGLLCYGSSLDICYMVAAGNTVGAWNGATGLFSLGFSLEVGANIIVDGGISVRSNVGGGTGVWLNLGTPGTQLVGIGQVGGAAYFNIAFIPLVLTSASITSDSRITAGSLGVGNAASATVAVGTLAKKIEVFDASGTSLGFVPVYASIT